MLGSSKLYERLKGIVIVCVIRILKLLVLQRYVVGWRVGWIGGGQSFFEEPKYELICASRSCGDDDGFA